MSYGGDVNRGPFLDTFNWIFTVIALSAVSLRLISRRWTERQPWDLGDAFIVFAMAANFSRAIYVSVCISMGFGQHLEALLEQDPLNTIALGRLLIILQSIGFWTFTLPKLPVVALLVRIFGTGKRMVPIVLYSLVGVQILLAIILTITTFVQCDPIAKNWNPTITTGSCWNPHIDLDLGYLLGTYSAILDMAFAVYPIMQIWKLQMDKQRKILIAASLSLGIVASITTIYKQTTISSLLEKGDPTWATVPLEVWNSVEGTALLIAAAVPLTRPLLSSIGTGFMTLTSRFTSRSTTTNNSKRFNKLDESRDSSSNSARRGLYSQDDFDDTGKHSDRIALRQV